MEQLNLYVLLKTAAEKNPKAGIIFYLPGNVHAVGKELKYPALLDKARENAQFIHRLGLEPGSIILLHFNNHLDNVEWFWSVISAGFVPAMSTPFTNNMEQRKKHIAHLHEILDDPICLTRDELLPQFENQNSLRLRTIDNFPPVDSNFVGPVDQGSLKSTESLAALMLTSGSSGNAKAVCLTHGQMLHSISSKSKEYGTDEGPFLNWIGFDHVACITEIHLHAMLIGADQVMVQAEDLVPNPLLFLELISKHRVSASFAPNFFLSSLCRAVGNQVVEKLKNDLDLSCLQCITSGGEANVVETGVAFLRLLEEFGAPENVLKPTFGMTETCAGAIYSNDFPDRDIECDNEFAAVGSCIDGIEMRITDDNGEEVDSRITGNLEVSGPIVFTQYYNNPKATKESFNDKWFITGDRGFVDSVGNLHLTGRKKETVIINGVNYYPFEIEAALTNISGTEPSSTVVFPYRARGAQTEGLCVVYNPTYSPEDIDTLVETNDAISKTVLLQTGIRPHILPLDGLVLQKSTLGKLPRAKIRASFDKGEYESYEKSQDAALARFRAVKHEAPTNATEELILKAFADIFDLPKHAFGVNNSMFAMGIDSIGLLTLKLRLQQDFKITNIPIVTIMNHSSIRELGFVLKDLKKPHVYNPTVLLKSQGSKAPLWFIHPGAGEVLSFVKLASYFDDRPIYAMRARGFEDGEVPFSDIQDILSTYYAKIKESQPTGPYAIAGYSFGSMIAFELTKLLLANNDEVKFLGVLNFPPHIKFRMRQLDWTKCVLHISWFLKLFDQKYAYSKYDELQKLPRDETLQHIMNISAPGRMTELGLDGSKLGTWADIANRMSSSAVDYEPSGMVDSMDVFCATPLVEVAPDMEDWKTNQLAKWEDFSKTAPRFHNVEGSLNTMLAQENVYTFQKRLKTVLEKRGI